MAAKADVTLDGQISPEKITAGREITYSFTLENQGPSDALRVTLGINPAPQLGDLRFSLNGGNDWEPWQGALNFDRIRAKDSKTALFRGQVDPSAEALISTTAELDADTPDPSSENNRLKLESPVLTLADLGVFQEESRQIAVAGEMFTFSVYVRNNGPSNAEDAALSGIISKDLGSLAVSLDDGNTWKDLQEPMKLGVIPAGETRKISIRGSLAASASEDVGNSWEAKSITKDPVEGNNLTRMQDKVTRFADLSILKKGNPDPVIAGVQLTYSIVVNNAGPSDAGNVTLESAPPQKLQHQEYSIDEGASWKAWKGSIGFGTIPATESRKALIRGQVEPSGTGRIVASAKVGSDSTDPDISNNASGNVVTTIIQVSDVAIAAVDMPKSIIAGENIQFSIAVNNVGPSDAASVVVRRDPSPQFVDLEYLDEKEGNWRRWETPLDLGTFPAGSSQRIRLRGKVSPLAKLSTKSPARVETVTTDPDSSNNVVNIAVGEVKTLADLSVTLTDSPDPVVAGSQLTYTATVRNSGPSEAQGVVLSDELPMELQKSRYSVDGGTTWKLWEKSVNLDTINAGSNKQVLILGRTDPSSSGLIMNTAGVQAKTQDPNLADNKAGLVRTEVLTQSDLSVVQKGQPETATAGERLTYRIVVQNAGPSNARHAKLELWFSEHLRNPEMSLDLGKNWKPVASIVDLETFPTRSSKELWIRCELDSSITDFVSSRFKVDSDAEDDDAGNNVTELKTEIRTRADLSLAFSLLPSESLAGTGLTYGLAVRNEGPSDSLDVLLAAQLSDDHMGNVQFSTDDGKSWQSWKDSVQLEGIGAGDDKRLLIRGDLKTSAKGSLQPIFTVSSGKTSDPNENNNKVEPESVIDTKADLTVEIVAPTDPVVAGTPFSFGLRIRNAGPSDAENVELTGKLPQGLLEPRMRTDQSQEWKPWSGSFALGTIPAKAVRDLQIRCSVAPSATGNLIHTAEVESSTEDPRPADNHAETPPVSIGTRADLSVVRVTDVPDAVGAALAPVTAGETLTYTLNVKNAGPSDAGNASLELILPEGLRNPSVSLDQGRNWSVAEPKVALDTIAAQSTKGVLIRCDVDPSATDSVTSRFKVGSQTEDPDAGNDLAEWRTEVRINADLSLASSDVSPQVVAGTQIMYGLAVRNLGPSDSGETMLSVWPIKDARNLQFSTDGGEKWESWGDVLNLGTISAGKVEKILVRGDVSSSARGTLQATFEVSSGKTPDSDKSNDKVQLESMVDNKADLALAMKASHESAVAGTPLTYTLEVDNNGPSDAENVELIDQLTDILAEPHFRTDQGREWKPWVGSLSLGTIPATKRIEVEIRSSLDSSATKSLTNAAEVRSTTQDPEVTNNHTETLRTGIRSEADLFIEQVVESPANLIAGTEFLRSITIANKGPSDAAGVVIGDAIPTEISDPEYSLDGDESWNPWTGALSLGKIRPGETKQIRVRAVIAGGTGGPLTHKVTVQSETRDPDAANNTSKVSSEVVASADLELIISDAPSEVTAGAAVAYTINLKNNGPSDAVGCRVEEEITPKLKDPKVSTDDGKTWQEWEGHISVGSIPAGSSKKLKIRGLVASSASDELVHSVGIAASTGDPLAGNNSSVTRASVRKQSDLAVLGTADPEVVAGNQIVYRIRVRNNGPSDADEVRLTHLLPGGVKELEYSTDEGGHWNPLEKKSIEIEDIRAGTGKEVLIQGKVDASLAGEIRATASLESKSPDPNSENNHTGSIVSGVLSEADLRLTLVDFPESILAGGTMEYSAKIENKGPSDAAEVVLEETVSDAGFKHREYAKDGLNWEPWNGNLSLGTLRATESRLLKFRCILDSSLPESTQQLAVTLSSATRDPDPGNHTFKESVKVDRLADLSITKETTMEPVTVGQFIEYIVKVENKGPSDAMNVVIEENLPETIENPEFVPTEQEAWKTLETPLQLGMLAAGVSKQVRIRGRVSLSAQGAIQNRATVNADTRDPVSDNNTAFQKTAVKTLADLSIAMTTSPDPVTAGARISYIISTFNAGPSTAENVGLSMRSDPMIEDLTSSTDGGASWNELGSVLELGSISAGNSRHVLVRGIVDRGAAGTVGHSASVTSDTHDPQLENNETEEIMTTIAAKADLAITMVVAPHEVDAGNRVLYTITVANEGPSDATDVVVRAQIAPGIQDAKGSLDGGGTWNDLSDQVDLNTLRAGTSKLVLIVGTVKPGLPPGVLSNEAYVRSGTDDPVSENNTTARVSIEVKGAP